MRGELLLELASLGVGGLLAVVMFAVYRKDALAAQERIHALATLTASIIEKFIETMHRVDITLAQHTALVDRLLHRLDEIQGIRIEGVEDDDR